MPPRPPAYGSVPAVRYPFAYRNTISVDAGSTHCQVIAPFNDIMSYTIGQAASPPNASTAVNTSSFIDPYLTDLLAPTTTSSSTLYSSVRPISMCVEIGCLTPIQTIGASVLAARWPYGNMADPGATAVSFAQLWGAVSEMAQYVIQPSAYFASSKCFHSVMRDRNALEFSISKSGITSFKDMYLSPTDPATEATVGCTLPWSPIVLFFLNSSANAQAFNFLYKGEYEFVPPMSSSWLRVAKPLPPPSSAGETAWWKHCASLNRSGLSHSAAANGRTVTGFLGIEDDGAHQKQKYKKKRREKAETTTPQPAANPPRNRGKMANSLKKALMEVIVGSTGQTIMNSLPGRLSSGQAALRDYPPGLGGGRRRRR